MSPQEGEWRDGIVSASIAPGCRHEAEPNRQVLLLQPKSTSCLEYGKQASLLACFTG